MKILIEGGTQQKSTMIMWPLYVKEAQDATRISTMQNESQLPRNFYTLPTILQHLDYTASGKTLCTGWEQHSNFTTYF